MSRVLLMSLKPAFADAAFRGVKRFEYRRSRVSAKRGDIVLIYETAPIRHVTGFFVVGRVIVDPSFLLTMLEPDEAIREAVTRYLAEAVRSSALEITSPTRWRVPRALSEVCKASRPPQSYCFVDGDRDQLLRNFG